MAKDRSTTAESYTSTSHSTDHTAFHAGDKVEYQGKLAKVVNYGFLELPSLPGQDTAVSEKLVAHLQLPAKAPGGKPEYAFFVSTDQITALKDNPKRQLSLEREFNPLFGDKAPAAEAEEAPAPKIRKEGQRTATPETVADRSKRAPIDMAHATGADKIDGNTGTAKTVTTEPKAAKKSAAKSSKKSGGKKAK